MQSYYVFRSPFYGYRGGCLIDHPHTPIFIIVGPSGWVVAVTDNEIVAQAIAAKLSKLSVEPDLTEVDQYLQDDYTEGYDYLIGFEGVHRYLEFYSNESEDLPKPS